MKQTLVLIKANFSGSFTEKDFIRVIKPLIHHQHTKHLLHHMTLKGELIRYGSGRYKATRMLSKLSVKRGVYNEYRGQSF